MPELPFHLPEPVTSLPSWLWWSIGLLIGVPLLLRMMAFQQLRRKVFRPGGVTLDQVKKLPPHHHPILEAADKELQSMGFGFWGALRDQSQMSAQHARLWLVYQHPSPPTLVRVAVSHEVSRLASCEAIFSSYRKTDGKYIDTQPRPVVKAIPLPDDVIADGRIFTSLAEQWQHHQAKVQPMGEAIRFPDPAAWVQRADELGKGDLPRLAARGVVKAGREPGTYRLSMGTAWRAAGQMLKSEWKGKTATKPAQAPGLSPQIMAELDFDHWCRERAEKAAAQSMSMTGKLIMLALSITVSAWAWQEQRLDTPAVIGILAVLLVHELGHWLAMLVFGYRNLSILFIPFFGAVATSARKPDVSAWKEIIVVLAGPLPGLAAGIVALVLDCWGLPWLRWPAQFAIVVNALNLLPVLPMDGGHLLRLALQARWPRLQALLQTLSAFGMIALGLAGGQFLIVLGVLQLLRAGLPWFIARLVSREHRAIHPVKGSREPHSEEEAGRRAFQAIWAHPRYSKQSAPSRHLIAGQIVEQLRARRAGFFATFTALTACSIVFWSPIAAWFGVGWYADDAIVRVERENAAAGVPSTPEQAKKDPLCIPDPVHVKRWTALMNVVARIDADSTVIKDLDTLHAQQTARADPMKAQSAASTDPLVARQASMDATLPALPETLPDALGRFVGDLRNALLAEPKDVSQAIKTTDDPLNLKPLHLLQCNARRQLKGGRLEDWKADVLAAVRGVECWPTRTTEECRFRSACVRNLLTIIEEGWPELAAHPDQAFVDELIQRLPTPDGLMKRRALALFTDTSPASPEFAMANDEAEDAATMRQFQNLQSWMQRSPPAKLLRLSTLRQKRKLWEAVHSGRPVDWAALGAQWSNGLRPALIMFAPPETTALAAVGTEAITQGIDLRPAWQLFRMAANFSSSSLKATQLASNCKRTRLADGSEALVLTPPSPPTTDNNLADALRQPQPVMWRLPKPQP